MGIKDFLEKTKEELKSKYLWKAIRAEFLGSILYVTFGCSANFHKEVNYVEFFSQVFSFGLILMLLIKTVGHASGGHFNPAVTISFICTRYISCVRGVCYIIVQIIGSICGSAILYGLIPHDMDPDQTVTRINPQIDNVRAFGFEFLSTFFIVFTYFGTLENKNNVLVPDFLACGLSLSLAVIFAWKMTGASVNPARSFGPALIHNVWDNHWIYWIGPILGGIFGGFTHEFTNKHSEDLRNFQTSLKQHVYSLQRKENGASSNSLTTELACEQDQTEELQI